LFLKIFKFLLGIRRKWERKKTASITIVARKQLPRSNLLATGRRSRSPPCARVTCSWFHGWFPSSYWTEPATILTLLSSRRRRRALVCWPISSPPLHLSQFTSQPCLPHCCIPFEPTRAIPLHGSRLQAIVFLGDVCSAAMSPLAVGSPLWHLSFLSILCFGSALLSCCPST
jgi:hypothetical protein